MLSYLNDLEAHYSYSEEEARRLNPLTLAYLGDVVYELAVRTMIVRSGEMSPAKMNRAAVGLVRAEKQSAMAEKLSAVFTAMPQSRASPSRFSNPEARSAQSARNRRNSASLAMPAP